MAFLGRRTIISRIKELVPDGDPTRVTHSAYELCLGREGYSTGWHEPHRMDADETIVVGAGQFALLHTAEVVHVPSDAIGFLSIKYGIKRKGLINVSGFHVDPGYVGQIIFSVFNGGPRDITLRVGEPIFLIWWAELDGPTDMEYEHLGKPDRLPTSAINDIRPSSSRSQPISLSGLEQQMTELRSRVEILIGLTLTAGAGLLTILVTIAVVAVNLAT